MSNLSIAVLAGGISKERNVSLESGQAVTAALKKNYSVDLIELNEMALPKNLDPDNQIIFLTLHGTFGEDGEIQKLLEKEKFSYVGCDSESSRLCINKKETKTLVADSGIRVAKDLLATAPNLPTVNEVVAKLGSNIVVIPLCEGSSIDVFIVENEEALNKEMAKLISGNWLFEQRIQGREISIGVLEGKGMGLVEIIPKNGIYDYRHKYTEGMTEYHYPARLGYSLEKEIREVAESVFDICGCRDFIRVDFMASNSEESYFLEINTLPGLTSTSLLRKSACCLGYDFPQLAQRLVLPAINRFYALRSN